MATSHHRGALLLQTVALLSLLGAARGGDIPAGAQYNALRAQRDALVAWAAGCDYPNWNGNYHWDATEDPCKNRNPSKWSGVDCVGNQGISIGEISLTLQYVKCDVEHALGSSGIDWGLFPQLHDLQLSANYITGNLTASIGANVAQLGNLQKFNLAHNQIGGDLTHITFAALTSLRGVDLRNNILAGPLPLFPDSLKVLKLSQNVLNGNLGEFFQRPHSAILHIDLAANRFDGSLPSFGDRTLHPNLIYIDLSYNKLHGPLANAIGASGASATGLQSIFLQHNFLDGAFPPAVGALADLQFLYVQGNQLRGALPILATSFTGSVNFGGSDNSSYGAANGATRHGNIYDCPIPDARPLYDSAQCICGAGREAVGGHVAYPGGCDLAFANDGSGNVVRTATSSTLAAACLNSGRFQCNDCSLGRFTAHEWSSTCGYCAPGTKANVTGRTACTNCTVGMFTQASGRSTCDNCALGLSSAAARASSCFACGVGKYGISAGKPCADCEPGTYASTTQLTVCEMCHGGRFAALYGMDNCTDCSAGGYATKLRGSFDCMSCPQGQIATAGSLSSVSCQQCPAGTYADSFSFAQKCLPCAQGRHSPSDGSTTCASCEVFTDVQRALFPKMCPDPPLEESSSTNAPKQVSTSLILGIVFLVLCGGTFAVIAIIIAVVVLRMRKAAGAEEEEEGDGEKKASSVPKPSQQRNSLASADSEQAWSSKFSGEDAEAPAPAPSVAIQMSPIAANGHGAAVEFPVDPANRRKSTQSATTLQNYWE